MQRLRHYMMTHPQMFYAQYVYDFHNKLPVIIDQKLMCAIQLEFLLIFLNLPNGV
jgi:hypothetical protein